MLKKRHPFLAGKKRKSSSHLDDGVGAGLDVLADAAPAPVALVASLVIGAGFLGFLAWKAVTRSTDRVD
ncbi:hypothetical protein DDF62_03445 [Caulobacter radicis]|uniref:hypothetical protein n=1 Tax=Caulobacter radicis TaxID=2172650 RepID=UPI000D573192|nr:hypothetical protein [Caulobacter radicis]PVM92217.1 hypothetical protein DDF62_03445 [Caulobacter radicis]